MEGLRVGVEKMPGELGTDSEYEFDWKGFCSNVVFYVVILAKGFNLLNLAQFTCTFI